MQINNIILAGDVEGTKTLLVLFETRTANWRSGLEEFVKFTFYF
jgi:hypothetical protein